MISASRRCISVCIAWRRWSNGKNRSRPIPLATIPTNTRNPSDWILAQSVCQLIIFYSSNCSRESHSRSVLAAKRFRGYNSQLNSLHRVPAQPLLDAEQLIVLTHSVSATQRAGLDLAGVGRHRDVGDGRVLGFARTMADDRSVTGFLPHLDRVERFGERDRKSTR